MRHLVITLILLITCITTSSGQHTLGVLGGWGTGSERIYPTVEGKTVYGLLNGGVTWRRYGDKPSIGCFGIDLEFMERGFSYSPYASLAVEGETLYYYTRYINTIMLPIVWQPHTYIFDRRARLFFEAAATFHYDLSSTYVNEYIRNRYPNADIIWQGDYEYKTARDNRLGYGLAGGVGISYLTGKFEIMVRGRYYFDYSDVVRNRTVYYSNNNDNDNGYENPFYLTPIRSPLSNINVSLGVVYHFGEEGFKAWGVTRIKPEKEETTGFNYDGKSTTTTPGKKR